MLREAAKVAFRPCVCGPERSIAEFIRKHRLHTKLPYRLFPVMGVTVSSNREKRVVGTKRVPAPSFASFSTTGTLTTEAGEGERASFSFKFINKQNLDA